MGDVSFGPRLQGPGPSPTSKQVPTPQSGRPDSPSSPFPPAIMTGPALLLISQGWAQA